MHILDTPDTDLDSDLAVPLAVALVAAAAVSEHHIENDTI